MKGLREGWREVAAEFLAPRLKFLDEMGSHLALTRLYGRAAPGERVSQGVPQNYGENVTMLAAIGLGGVSAPMTVEGAVDGAVFLADVREVLGPTLAGGDIVVMDNLRAHKVARTSEALEGALKEALATVTPSDALAWFVHCGYPVH